MKINTITGGKSGFQEAINDAFESNINNPMIRYSESRGFHVESRQSRADDDVVWSTLVYYDLNKNGARSIRAAEYPEIRMEILDILDA